MFSFVTLLTCRIVKFVMRTAKIVSNLVSSKPKQIYIQSLKNLS